jgi:hypothetical protein
VTLQIITPSYNTSNWTLKKECQHSYQKETRIPFDNLKEIIGENAQSFMAYGHNHCLYSTVIEAAGIRMKKKEHVPADKKPLLEVYNGKVGSMNKVTKRPSGSAKIIKILSGADCAKDPSQAIRRLCKTGLTNIILDNFVRKEEITPIIFAIKISFMEKPSHFIWQATPEAILSKTAEDPNGKKYTTYVTASEIRRAYKLCTDKALPDKFKRIARRSLKFVEISEERIQIKKDILKVTDLNIYVATNETITYRLKEIPAPWEEENAKEFSRQLDIRKGLSRPSISRKPSWRFQALDRIS